MKCSEYTSGRRQGGIGSGDFGDLWVGIVLRTPRSDFDEVCKWVHGAQVKHRKIEVAQLSHYQKT